MSSIQVLERADGPLPRTAAANERSLPELEREICALAAHLAAATCRWLLLVAEFDERGGWAVDGLVSCAHWLSWRCSVGLRAAREQVRVARSLRDLQLVRRAFASGELSYCKVRALTRVATAETEQQLVELARHATGAQLEKLVRGYQGALKASTDQARRAHERRYLSLTFDDDGSVILAGRLPAEEGALVKKALDAAAAGQDDAESAQTDNPVGARRADALVTLARSALDGGLPERVDGEPVELVVHVDSATLASERVSERSELEGGPPLAPETVRRLGCDAALSRIIERDGRPLSISRRKRTIPPALRRALRARDGGCAFPGCTHTRFLHAHHIHHWARGGPTKLDNLVQLCSHHHRLVHEGGYRVERTGSSISFRRPGGKEIPRASVGARVRGPTIDVEHRTRGIVIDPRNDQAAVSGRPA